MSYQKGAAATVGESGPWNVDDNFWATRKDPTPRRKFADLALGMPEAQAAYFDGYNGGADQFGRTVSAPFAIDLARQVSIDIGLEPGKNDWIDVSFLWTEGWDGSSKANPPKAGDTAIPQATIIPIEVAAPGPDGSIVHVVQEGQTLWNIAAAYQISLAELMRLNGLTEGAIIVPGQKLLVKSAGLTATPSITATQKNASHTPPPTFTPRPSSPPRTQAATEIARALPEPGQTPSVEPDRIQADQPAQSSGTSRKIDPILLGIIAAAGAGFLLFLFGQIFKRQP
jgi:LysM repeat protein